MGKTTRVNPRNASNSDPNNTHAAQPLPVANAARTIASSLKNEPNGGAAVTDNNPAMNKAADNGVTINMPLTSSDLRPPAARRTLPAVRKSAPFVMLLFQT